METAPFQTSLDDGLFHIILNRPDEGNSFTTRFCTELNRIANDISENPAVRAVLLSATGRFFSVGGDIGMMSGERPALPGIVKTLTSPLHMALVRLRQMNAPVVCAVNGKGAFGGALAIARQLAAGPTLAFGEIKRLFGNVSSTPLSSQLEEEAQALARVARTADAWEGMTAFMQKRAAKFEGK
jgi:2-(1,2-epoxy-1,2-dihydrophenyl)acetyl-CoA isomerase